MEVADWARMLAVHVSSTPSGRMTMNYAEATAE